ESTAIGQPDIQDGQAKGGVGQLASGFAAGAAGREGEPLRLQGPNQVVPDGGLVLHHKDVAGGGGVGIHAVSRVSGYKFHNDNWLEFMGSKGLKVGSVSSSWRGTFSNG